MTTEVSRYLEGRLRTLEKLLGESAETTRCEVEIGRAAGNKKNSDYMWYAEVYVKPPGGKTVYARNHAASVNAAIDDVKEEIVLQLRKTKRKERTTTRKGGAAAKRRMRQG
jgi:ribosome-associated translation inhibitor RaiA